MGIKITTTNALPEFMALEVMSESARMQAEGKDVIRLEIGQPSLSAPDVVTRALKKALDNPATHGYSQSLGTPELRARIARHYRETQKLDPSPDNIVVTPGSSMGFVLAFLAAFDRGDKIALPTPGYPAYRNLLTALGLEPVLIPARAEQNWIPDPETLCVDGKPPFQGMLIASPANPTGVVLNDAQVEHICDWCQKRNVRLIMDEIYHGLTFGKTPVSALHHSTSAIIVNSFSKYYCMTGWRVGWAIFPDDLIEMVESLVQNMYISPSTPMQAGAMAAFDDYAELDARAALYRKNRDVLLERLPKEFLGQTAPCDGAFYLYVDISGLGIQPDATRLAEALLDEAHVAVTPGPDFDNERGNSHLRLSFAGSTKDMERAAKRITEWLPGYVARQANKG